MSGRPWLDQFRGLEMTDGEILDQAESYIEVLEEAVRRAWLHPGDWFSCGVCGTNINPDVSAPPSMTHTPDCIVPGLLS